MVRNVAEISVFVASPNDVSEEREALEDIIRELNVSWLHNMALRLELVRWETHAYPSIGQDPQAVINEQIGNDYDIFIGILWKKFGTPTGRSASGTEEEFKRAYARHKRDPRQIRIMFYFRSTSPPNLDQIDLDQLAQVNRFRDDLGETGSLHWKYRDKEDFTRLVRIHLSRHIKDWGKTWGTTTPHLGQDSQTQHIPESVERIPAGQESTEAVEEEGFLDLLDVGNESFENLKALTERMVQAIQMLLENTKQRTEEIQQTTAGGEKPDIKVAKRIINTAADNLDQFSMVMEAEVPAFRELFSRGIEAHSRAASLLPDFASEQEDGTRNLADAILGLGALHSTMQESLIATDGLRNSIAGLPRMTTRHNHSKRRVLSILDRYISETTAAINLVDETRKTYESIHQSLSQETK
jgi:hypothetical protein